VRRRSGRCSPSGAGLWLALLGLGAAACGPTSDPGGGVPLDDGGRPIQQDASSYSSWDGGSPWGPDDQPDAGPCAAETTKAQQLPLDIYIMLDQSASMDDPAGSGSQTKWGAVTAAISSFLGQPDLTGISVGIQFFGLPPGGGNQCSVYDCNTDADCGQGCGPCVYDSYYGYSACAGAGSEDSCNPADYANPSVEITALPGAKAQIDGAMAAHSPNTLTPTSAALQGAIDHAKSWAASNPDHAVIVILATDGEPTECDTDLGNIDAIAAAGASATPSKILTFVIGVGDSLSNLNGIAAAGGTSHAFLVDTSADVNSQFLAALNAIRGAALGCQYQIPVPQEGLPDYDKVNVQYTPGGGGAPALIPMVAAEANCPGSGLGWYYDNPAHPTQILLCPGICDMVKNDPAGQVDVLTGCTTVID
jgi:hypothetical protein